ncbi:MAG TPA: 2-phospho-L-lactate guanylyltransferase [Acidimicrobiales bacterium]|nr:2-phospho-L-lactate guanylyltransferase [Acidimicrobiales bacterium]
MEEIVLIPVKAFEQAKERLAPALSPALRADLARRLAEAVVEQAAPLPVAVACDDPSIAIWARSLGASVMMNVGSGLNPAVQSAAWDLVASGAQRVTIVHADIPDPSQLSSIGTSAGPERCVIVPDSKNDGTNLISIPASALRHPLDPTGFIFKYGPESFQHHLAEAERLQLNPRVVRGSPMSFDVDEPHDLDLLGEPFTSFIPTGPHDPKHQLEPTI